MSVRKRIGIRRFASVAVFPLREDERFCSPDCPWKSRTLAFPDVCELFQQVRVWPARMGPAYFYRCRACHKRAK